MYVLLLQKVCQKNSAGRFGLSQKMCVLGVSRKKRVFCMSFWGVSKKVCFQCFLHFWGVSFIFLHVVLGVSPSEWHRVWATMVCKKILLPLDSGLDGYQVFSPFSQHTRRHTFFWVNPPGLVLTHFFQHTFWVSKHTFLATWAVAILEIIMSEKNVRRYARKNARRYVRRNVRTNVRKNAQKIAKKELPEDMSE